MRAELTEGAKQKADFRHFLPRNSELRKLMLAEGMLDGPALIVMDEPTNHLDLHATETLERALASYPGALVVVSHDQAFLDACTSIRWVVDEGRVRIE